MTPAVLHALLLAATLAQAPAAPPSPAPADPKPIETKPAPTTLDDRLRALDARVAALTDLTADFRQEKSTPLLKKPIVSTGRLLVKGARVKWETLEPRRSTMLLADNEIRVLYPDEKAMEVYPLEGDLRQLAGTPLPRLDWLRANFEIREAAVTTPERTTTEDAPLVLDLKPTREAMKEHVGSIRVEIDTRVPCVQRMVMTDPDAHRTVFELTNVKANTGMKDEALTLAAPEGVKVSRPTKRDEPKPGATKHEEPKADQPAGKPQ